MTIKVKKINKNLDLPKVIKKGEWIDLYASCDYVMENPYALRLSKYRTRREIVFNSGLVPLGIAMKLPDGYEAIVAPRSSSFTKFGFMQTNSIGVIDNSYSSDTDEWKLPIVALNTVYIKKGDRICQFRIQLSQKATFLQKLKWLFSSKIKIKEVESLGGNSRGGFGSTGK